MSDENMITVIVVKTGEKPEIRKIGNKLEDMQEIVGGTICMTMPYQDDVAIVCNDEGKINGMPLNRALYGVDGEFCDIIAGDFFLCRAPAYSEDFHSLLDEQLKRYSKMFKYPERFEITNDGIKIMQIKPKGRGLER